MNRNARLWMVRGGGGVAAVLIIIGAAGHLSWLAYVGAILMVALFIGGRQWLKR